MSEKIELAISKSQKFELEVLANATGITPAQFLQEIVNENVDAYIAKQNVPEVYKNLLKSLAKSSNRRKG